MPGAAADHGPVGGASNGPEAHRQPHRRRRHPRRSPDPQRKKSRRPDVASDITDLTAFARLIPADHGLTVVSTLRADGTVQSSVVNAGVLDHPLTGEPVVGFVAVGGARKLANLRARPRATVVARAGWEWAAVEGSVDMIGPDDPAAGIDGERVRTLLREVFTAAGGTHDDWETYDAVMAADRRTAVFISPDRTYGANAR